ncbi:hypothetical protein BJ165DRAFT_1440813 [Panaeolus papilionaceus]|nr:hypothetical protein BJ165DRAFT_1440813 [Panaeolus papilionaceus]
MLLYTRKVLIVICTHQCHHLFWEGERFQLHQWDSFASLCQRVSWLCQKSKSGIQFLVNWMTPTSMIGAPVGAEMTPQLDEPDRKLRKKGIKLEHAVE